MQKIIKLQRLRANVRSYADACREKIPSFSNQWTPLKILICIPCISTVGKSRFLHHWLVVKEKGEKLMVVACFVCATKKTTMVSRA